MSLSIILTYLFSSRHLQTDNLEKSYVHQTFSGPHNIGQYDPQNIGWSKIPDLQSLVCIALIHIQTQGNIL